VSTSDPIWFTPPPSPSRTPAPPEHPEPRQTEIKIDGESVQVPETMTILDACRSMGIDTPTLCYLENLTPVNVCRVCVVELAGARTLAPACSRKVEAGMDIKTNSDRVRAARKMVLEFLGSSVDLSTAPQAQSYMKRYEARPERYGLAIITFTMGAMLKLSTSRSRSITICMCGTTPSASFAINALKLAGPTRRIHLRSLSRGGVSMRGSQPKPASPCPIPHACTAEIVSVCVPPGRSCSRANTKCGRQAPGMRRSKRRPTPSVHIAASVAR